MSQDYVLKSSTYVRRLEEEREELLEAAKAWERWEADLILEAGPNLIEAMSTENYNRMLELQVQRNDAIEKAEGSA